ncbi:tail completion protein gp17 [Burkholderia multivorans]|uniref:tail completion protein gp17 n=1 Tax=Burkholderia TaxID=32008 RepID=UPI00066986CB|nr:DUF3168 domain-containing protein [Burkholderia multivorans]MBU9420065.1 DUF3168 domain-containing protein [Burkholderia multivorans]MCO1358826.1 DUF3168 domain-containing protein [Burkholderia multivorans]MCO1418654.1 DUF3168 domain-containing protein [Burkholderia multivorans]MDN7970673.1 DUF3168 domain-containing protein [Burkholderia multivorans]PRG91344.1 DUF3168 domain-containing protein [Burkholderia multivorans]
MSALIIRDAIGIVGGAKGYVSVAGSTAQSPYYVVSRVSGTRDMALGGATGGKSGMFQIDVYAKTYTEADSLADQIIDRVESTGMFSVGGVSDLPDDYSSDTGVFRVSLEISVQF